MANFVELLTNFHGRISRKSWWLGMLILFPLSLAGAMLLDPARYSLDSSGVPPPNLAATMWSLLVVFPMTAITVKRFNDRDWSNWLGYGYGLIASVQIIALHFGFLAGPGLIMGEVIYVSIFGSLGLFIVIVNGFLRGTKGPNRYGPDPLQST